MDEPAFEDQGGVRR